MPAFTSVETIFCHFGTTCRMKNLLDSSRYLRRRRMLLNLTTVAAILLELAVAEWSLSFVAALSC